MRARVLSGDDLRDIAEARSIPLDQVEKDLLLLSMAARLVERFPSQLCFKGGFVLRHGYGHDRFSGDVDATRHNPARHKLDHEAVATEIKAAGRPLFSIRGMNMATNSARSLDFDDVRYRGPIGEGKVAIEVSYREDVLLEPIRLPMGVPFFDPFEVPTMAPPEMMAEKLRTLAQRRRPTDLLDAGMLLQGLAGAIEDPQVAGLVPTKFASGLVRPGDHVRRIRANIHAMATTYETVVRAVSPSAPSYEEMASPILSRLPAFFQ